MSSPIKIPLPVNGVDLLSDETGFSTGYVRRAENVDIDRSGTFRRRPGATLVASAPYYHSLFSGKRGVLLGQGDSLYSVNPSTLATTLKGVLGTGPFDITEYNGHTYILSRDALWWIPSDAGDVRRAGVEPPNPLPTISADVGALTSGAYAVALARVDERGEESPCKFLGTVSTSGGVRLTGLPVEPAVTYRVYLTPPDGDVLYLAAEFQAVFSTYVVGELPDGAQRTSQHLQMMPGGDFVRWHAGRLYVMRGDVLHYSQPLRPHLTDPRHDFIQFVGVRFFEPVAGGIFVGDSRGTWFLPGNEPSEFRLQHVSHALAVKRSSLRLPSTHLPQRLNLPAQDCAVWLSTEGYVVGTAGGQVVELHPDRIRLADGLEGRSRLVIRNGVKQIITLTSAHGTQGYGVALDTSIQ